ncbi:MAG: beta-mannosidase [Acidobacteriaceae bacterium]
MMNLSRILRLVVYTLIVGGLSQVLSLCVWAAPAQSIELNQGWEFRQVTNLEGIAHSQWLPAKVPGEVPLDLLRNKLIRDPNYLDNEANLPWIENANWEYRTTIPVSAELLNRRNIELVFDGLDTCAEVYLNGNLLLSSDDMFRAFRVNAKPYLKLGDNRLLVVFTSPIVGAAKDAAKDKWWPDIKVNVAAKQYIRKAAYEWDTSGIWKPVRLEAWDDARIANLNIRQLDVTAQSAHILAEVEVAATVDTPATVKVNYEIDGKKVTATQDTELHPGVNSVDLPITIENPKLWYPAGYGGQPLYSFHAEVAIGGAIQDSDTVRTGLRSVVLRQDADRWGRSFEFVVNGIPIFAKGADVTPLSKFPDAASAEKTRSILQSVKDANMNMIRIWGGGYYETNDFYEICDELGIMVWQDFMFYNPWQPGNYEFKQIVTQEITDQIQRLRNHPSLVLWCGNNEEENNFLMDSVNVTPMARLQMWTDYLTVFSGIIPTLVARYDPATPYWPSSPSGNYEETKDKNYWVLEDGDDVGGNEQFGDTHDYTIGASIDMMPRLPFSSEEDRHYRFVSEYGFESFPDMQSIAAFTPPQDRTSTFASVMASYEKGANEYGTLHDYMLQYYGEPKDFASLVYGSQVLQAEFTKLVAEHLRRDRPRTMGSLFWDLNEDHWHRFSPSFGSLDYYGRWKALQYYARRFYSPLLVSSRIKDGNLAVSIVSDKTAPVPASLRVRIMKFDGTVLSTQTENITIPALSSKVYLNIPTQPYTNAAANPAGTVAAMDLTVGDKQVSSNLMYFVPVGEVHLPAAHIESKWTQANGEYHLHLSSRVLARSVYVSFEDIDAKVSDNYFDLLPDEPVTIAVDSKASLTQLENSMKLMSLVDAFVPDTVWKSGAGITSSAE